MKPPLNYAPIKATQETCLSIIAIADPLNSRWILSISPLQTSSTNLECKEIRQIHCASTRRPSIDIAHTTNTFYISQMAFSCRQPYGNPPVQPGKPTAQVSQKTSHEKRRTDNVNVRQKKTRQRRVEVARERFLSVNLRQPGRHGIHIMLLIVNRAMYSLV